jgi:AcrR family transcriptional regulator
MAEARNRHAILGAARDAFVAGGGEIEMGDVASRAGVSVGLAYHHYGSKAGLVAALISDFYDRYDAVVNQRIEAPTWAEQSRERLLRTICFLFEDPLAPIVLGRLGGSATVLALEASRREAIITRGAASIRAGQEGGEVDATLDPTMASQVVNGGLRQAIAMALAARERPDAADFAEQAWALVAGALGLRSR